MSTRSLSLLVAVLVLGIALTLRWYLDAETHAWAATHPAPVEVRATDLTPADPLAAPEGRLRDVPAQLVPAQLVPGGRIAPRVRTADACYSKAKGLPATDESARTPSCRERSSSAGLFRGAAGAIE